MRLVRSIGLIALGVTASRHRPQHPLAAAAATVITTLLALALLASPAGATEYQYEREWGATQAYAIAVDQQSNIYVAEVFRDGTDTPSRIEKFTSDGALVTRWEIGDRLASGIAIGPDDNVYVGDGDLYTGDANIEIYTPNGALVGSRTVPAASTYSSADKLEFDSQGNLYVIDDVNELLHKFDPNGVYLGAIGGPGVGDGQFDGATAVALDQQSNIYVLEGSNNYRVQRFSSSGAFLGKFGQFGASAGQFVTPGGLAVGPQGNLFETELTEVQEFTPSGAFVGTLPSFESADNVDGLFTARDLAFDPQGNLYVAEGSAVNRIVKFAPTGPATNGANRVKIASKSLKFKKGKVKVKIKCLGSGQCKGKATIKRGKKAKLAKGGYKLAAGKKKNATTKPTKQGKKQLKRIKGKPKVTVELKPKGGGEKVTKKLKLKG